MTLSVNSRFNRSAGRVLYLTGSQLTAYEWSGGRLREAYLFQAGEEGLIDFSRYLQEAADIPVYFLVDVVEEEYRRDTIPHVSARDRNALIAARSKRLFRETAYTGAVLQGRETEGRRDDRILYTALTNPGLLGPWMERIKQQKVPLGGIYSLPLLCESLLADLKIREPQVLLITLQGVGNMRQSYFQDGRLKLSRLAHIPARAPAQISEAIFDEIEKLRRYLNSLRLLEREQPLHIYLILGGDVYSLVDEQIDKQQLPDYHLLEIAELSARLKLGDEFVSPSADALFSHFLMQKRPPNHYATAQETRYFALHKLRFVMLAASVLCLVAGVFWSALDVIEGLIYQQRSQATQLQASHYRQRYEQARSGLPTLPDGLDSTSLRQVVEAADTVQQNRTTPLDIMQVVSLGLAGFPDIRVERLDWRIDNDPNGRVGNVANKRGLIEEEVRYEAELDEGIYHLAFVSGRVEPFDGDYRRALRTVRAFVDTLRSISGVRQVRILTLPLNVNSNQSLRGDAKAEPAPDQATFSIRIIYRGSHVET